jgi:hypothetical protein
MRQCMNRSGHSFRNHCLHPPSQMTRMPEVHQQQNADNQGLQLAAVKRIPLASQRTSGPLCPLMRENRSQEYFPGFHVAVPWGVGFRSAAILQLHKKLAAIETDDDDDDDDDDEQIGEARASLRVAGALGFAAQESEIARFAAIGAAVAAAAVVVAAVVAAALAVASLSAHARAVYARIADHPDMCCAADHPRMQDPGDGRALPEACQM